MSQTKKQRRAEEEKKERRNKLLAKLTLIVIAAAIVLIAAIVIFNAVSNATGFGLRHATAAESETVKVDNAMMSYYFYNAYASVMSNYGGYFSQYIDNTTSLKYQNSIYEGQTWFEFFLSLARDNVTQVMTLAEGAKAAGLELTDAERAICKKQADATDPANYGQGLSRADLTRALELATLASKYEEKIKAEAEPDAAALTAFIEENPNEYKSYSYRSYSFTYSTAEGDGYMPQSEALEQANILYECTDEDEYLAALRTYLESTGLAGDALEEALDATLSQGAPYAATDFADAAFADDAKIGMTYTASTGDNTLTVYMLTELPYFDESRTVSVRHILIMPEDAGSDEAARAEAERILADFKAGDGDEAAFAALAAEYSSDPGSFLTGGLYKDVAKDYMIEEFDAWIFDETRQPGDTGIVATDYGYHVMYFVGEGHLQYQADAAADMVAGAYSDAFTALGERYPVTFNEENLNKIVA